MADRLAGGPGRDLELHLAECSRCREEWDEVSRTWEQLGQLPEEEPGPNVRARFYQMLEAYEEGARAAAIRGQAVRRKPWWHLQPVFQLAAAAAVLVIGIVAGRTLGTGQQGGGTDMAALRSEVQNMRQLVALSLLQQQSASDRLRGVNYSYRVSASDTEVLSALLSTVNSDPSVNVRLSAVDALRKFGESPVARRGIALALGKQESPLVQIALLSVIDELGDADAKAGVEALAQNASADPTVRERARQVAQHLRR